MLSGALETQRLPPCPVGCSYTVGNTSLSTVLFRNSDLNFCYYRSGNIENVIYFCLI